MTDTPAAARPPDQIPAARLSRHVLQLERGNRVQVAVAGKGVPLVLVHGFTAEGFLYAQTLSRLVSSGFQVVAVDTAGHGGTDGLTDGGGNMQYHAGLLGRVVDHLGIRRAVFAGHSMGGRLVTELVARQPRRAIAVVLIDAIVGDTWDGMVQLWRMAPPLMGVTGAALVFDMATALIPLPSPRQAVKLGRLWAPVWLHNVRRPLSLIGPAASILRSAPTGWMLDRLADERVCVVVVHGDRDLAVPLRTAREAAARSRGHLVVVHGATHSWPLRDPETLPGLVDELLDGCLGDALRQAELEEGLDPGRVTADERERAFCETHARLLALTPAEPFTDREIRRSPPRYRWTHTPPEV